MAKALTIKVCGLRRRCDVELCGALGVDMAGFIFHPASPRAVRPRDVAALPQKGMQRVGVFVRQDAREIQSTMDEAGLDLAQFHGEQNQEDAAEIGPQRVIRVVWPERFATAEALQAHLDAWADWCRCFLCDSGVAGGGHGRALRGTMSLQQARFPRPWLLAGGVGAMNVQKKIEQFQPDGIDMNSGVEKTPGEKNREQLTAATQMVRGLQK
ncbi:MAG: phosphoribosylanthranilate isomerase [Thermodesulfobacteriota bacterium]